MTVFIHVIISAVTMGSMTLKPVLRFAESEYRFSPFGLYVSGLNQDVLDSSALRLIHCHKQTQKKVANKSFGNREESSV
jgi:hypothetical protein